MVSEDLGHEAQDPPEYGILEQPAVFELREEEKKAAVEYEEREEVTTVKDVETVPVVNGTDQEAEDEDEEEEEFLISRSTWKPLTRSDSSEILLPAEKPPVSVRFGRRKTLRSSPEGMFQSLS